MSAVQLELDFTDPGPGDALGDRTGPCPGCSDLMARWLDFRLPKQVKIINHATYDDTDPGIRDNSRGRFDQWRQAIRAAHQHISDICRREDHPGRTRFSTTVTRRSAPTRRLKPPHPGLAAASAHVHVDEPPLPAVETVTVTGALR